MNRPAASGPVPVDRARRPGRWTAPGTPAPSSDPAQRRGVGDRADAEHRPAAGDSLGRDGQCRVERRLAAASSVARVGVSPGSPGRSRDAPLPAAARAASAAAAATAPAGSRWPEHAVPARDRRGDGELVQALVGDPVALPGRHRSLSSSSGARSRVAWASPLTALVSPGPRVTTAAPGVPVSSPNAPAMTQAAVSPWARVNGMPCAAAAPIMSRFGPPPGHAEQPAHAGGAQPVGEPGWPPTPPGVTGRQLPTLTEMAIRVARFLDVADGVQPGQFTVGATTPSPPSPTWTRSTSSSSTSR